MPARGERLRAPRHWFIVASRSAAAGKSRRMNLAINFAVNPWIAAAVFGATAITDAAYVFFNAAVVARHRIRAANWSAVWYMLSAFSVISYTENPIYVVF